MVLFFSIASYELNSISNAITLVKDSVSILDGIENDICETFKAPKSLNGTHGFVSTKSHVSVELTAWSLQKLQEILDKHSYQSLNMLSMMTLNVEHFHSTTHIKQVMLSPLQYAMSFITSIKESLKRGFPWAAYYFTSSKGSWYPPSENSLNFMDVSASLPKKKYSDRGIRKKDEEEEMRQWAQTYTKGVRQRSVRQETTMDKSGTLPHYLYTVDLAKQAAQREKYTLEVEEEDEIESNCDKNVPNEPEDEFSSEDDHELDCIEEIEQTNTVPDVNENAFFLIGRTSRFGRAIKVNNKLFS